VLTNFENRGGEIIESEPPSPIYKQNMHQKSVGGDDELAKLKREIENLEKLLDRE
jgi:hypothetical protein